MRHIPFVVSTNNRFQLQVRTSTARTVHCSFSSNSGVGQHQLIRDRDDLYEKSDNLPSRYMINERGS
jgi:hypothetical protein